ncbi:MAG: hypothetical protein GF331_18330 [Chitinivibrionales bacterium]|nr:hypothetical protein [Chitinivibrionales bacterium]
MPSETEWAKAPADILKEYLPQYFSIDLVSAGMPQSEFYGKGINPECGLSLMERWPRCSPM